MELSYFVVKTIIDSLNSLKKKKKKKNIKKNHHENAHTETHIFYLTISLTTKTDNSLVSVIPLPTQNLAAIRVCNEFCKMHAIVCPKPQILKHGVVLKLKS